MLNYRQNWLREMNSLAVKMTYKIRAENFEVDIVDFILKDMIPTKRHWTKFTYWDYKLVDGNPSTACFCLSGCFKFIEQKHPLLGMGSITYTYRMTQLETRLGNLIGKEYGYSIPSFNDDADTVYEDIVKVLQSLLTILLKEKRESSTLEIIKDIEEHNKEKNL